YKNVLYATTVEPIGAIYNTKALNADKLPKTYSDMIAFLKDNKAELQGKVATFDPEKSGSGFLHDSNDARKRKDFWDLAKAMGEDGAKLYSSSGGMKETVVSGENVIAINIIGSYALNWVKESPNLGVHFASDYTPAFSRLALIVKDAPHPNAAKLFVDFMLSKDGQTALAEGGLPSVRKDVSAGLNIDTLNERVGGGLKPIAVDEGLVEYMEPAKRVQFLNDWKAAIGR
ncbi:MAG: ABC transporter substrate-binding protein, partial [Mesorhizobium sp.]